MKCSFFLILFILMRMSKMGESQTEHLHPTQLQPADIHITQTHAVRLTLGPALG